MPITFQTTNDERKEIRAFKKSDDEFFGEDIFDRYTPIWNNAVERAGRRIN